MAKPGRILVVGGSGFIGRALIPRLLAAGYAVRGTSRSGKGPLQAPGLEWVACDLLKTSTIGPAVHEVDQAFYLAHSMGHGQADFRDLEHQAAENFATAAAAAHLQRIVYLGGVAPIKNPSQHLASRLSVGHTLRGGQVPTLELRAAMVIGAESASWQLLRDVAKRLPAMILPSWTKSRMRPIALEDALEALVRGLTVDLPESAWFDIPGPEMVSGREMIERIAAIDGRRIPSLKVPFVTPGLSSHWLRLVTRLDYSLAKELVLGLTGDLLPKDDRFWERVGYTPSIGFDEAARRALKAEGTKPTLTFWLGHLEERLVGRLGPRLKS